jgi:neutral ceramidase
MKTMTGGSLFVGVSKRLITPEVGRDLAGFDARIGVSTGIHDDLFARALVIADDARAVALVSLDLIGITQSFTDSVRSAVKASTGIAERDVILCATHTHCAPLTIHHFYDAEQELDSEYMQMLLTQVVEAIEEAFERREPAVIKTGLVPVKGVASNRRAESGEPIDQFAGVIVIEDTGGRTKSVLVNYACHPTVLGPNTLEVTRDFPNYLIERLEEHFGEAVVPIYFNGTEGDLSIGHKSYLSAVGVIASYRTFEKAKEVGERLANYVIDSLDTLQIEVPELAAEHGIVSLPLKAYPPLAEVRRAKEAASAALKRGVVAMSTGDLSQEDLIHLRQESLFARIDDYYASLCELSKPSATLPVEVSVVRLGKTAILSVPGEVFVEIGLEIRRASPLPRTMIFGLANDYIGYVATVDAAKSSGYEVVASRVTPEASLLLTREAIALLEKAAMPPLGVT